jgi:hypothetical protein
MMGQKPSTWFGHKVFWAGDQLGWRLGIEIMSAN